MHLQEVVAGAGHRQFEEVEADAAAPTGGDGKGEEQTCIPPASASGPVFGPLAAALLDHPTRPMPAPGPHRSFLLRSGLLYRRSPRGDRMCIPAAGSLRDTVLQELHATVTPQAVGGALRARQGARPRPALGAVAGSVGRRGGGVRAHPHVSASKRTREEPELRVRIVVARAAGWAGAIAKAPASEKIGWVGPPGDVHDAVLMLGLWVEPGDGARVAAAAALEARVAQLEGRMRQVGPKCQELQHVGRMRALGPGQPARPPFQRGPGLSARRYTRMRASGRKRKRPEPSLPEQMTKLRARPRRG